MAQYEASNLPQRQFCQQHDIAYSTFGYWRKQLHHDTPPQTPTPDLLELPIFDFKQNPDQKDWRVELELGQGLILRLR